MSQAPRIVRWTLPALLLTLVVGGSAIVVASGRGGESRSASPTRGAGSKHKPRRVKVHSGDTPSSIARRARLSVLELLKLNPDVDPRLLRPGQKLTIAR